MTKKDYIKHEPLFRLMMDNMPKREERFSPIGFYFGFLHRSHFAYIQQQMPGHDLNPGEIPFLSMVRNSPGISQNEISKILFVDKALTARILKGLEKKGYIIRKANPSDKRINRIYITKKAVESKERCRAVHKKWIKILTADVTDSELRNLKKVLRKLCNNIIHSRYKNQNQSGDK